MTQQITTAFWPLFPTRSDGKAAVLQKGRQVENGPSAEQLDRTPNAQGQSDYYRLLDSEEPKHLDWRKKLGGMLMREIGGKGHEDKWQQCVLWDFPEGYRLYEHIKSKADGQAKAVKNHSGGGHDRQDAYLYGHPKGQKKRFRSPVEFFPHLLWLLTDETNDPENCSCKLCSPLQLEDKSPAPSKQPPVAVQPGRQSPIVQIPVRQPSQPQQSSASPAPNPTPQPSQMPSRPAAPTPTAAAPTPTPLPQLRSVDQQVDAQYNKMRARVGEITWFQREEQSWGLGVIIRRWIPKDGPSNQAYMVQPLSYPDASPPPPVNIMTDVDRIKPWLAWSAPACTFQYLNQHPLSYNEVSWPALRSGQYGSVGTGNPEVDASILASKMVDSTYTLFERLRTTVTQTGQEERYFNGIFLGGEKMWTGEPVRIHVGSGNDIMVVTGIVERIQPASQANPTPASAVHVLGDIYTTAFMPATDPNNPPSPPNNQHLPIRMREDMRWRNQYLIPATRTMSYWNLAASQQRLDISEVKGRWFETSIYFQDFFHNGLKSGNPNNVAAMNSRGASGRPGQPKVVGTRVDDRLSAFGASIPKNTTLVDGVEPPSQNVPAQQPGHEMQMDQAPAAGGDNEFSLNEFMNLDNIAEDGMAFEQQFTFDQPSAWPS